MLKPRWRSNKGVAFKRRGRGREERCGGVHQSVALAGFEEAEEDVEEATLVSGSTFRLLPGLVGSGVRPSWRYPAVGDVVAAGATMGTAWCWEAA
eukprot:9487683-Pyramimonas_sp.AAC.1